MSKQYYQGNDDDCPICGGKIWGRGKRVLLEGAKIIVCQSCAQYGKPPTIKPKGLYSKKTTSVSFKKRDTHIATPIKTIRRARRRFDEIDDLEIINNYAKVIRNVRMKIKLTQEQFAQKLNEKPSLIRRIESGKVAPTIKLAKKIEKVYNVKLLKEKDEIQVSYKDFLKKKGGASLGDIAFIKKKK
ncbi:MAG: multiprotein bridging factor aMBF1 [Promethearchaeota archaeon]